MRRHRKWLIHFLAECFDCGWNTQDFQFGQKLASEHARKTGHRMHGEEGYAVRYNDKEACDMHDAFRIPIERKRR